MNVLDLKRAFPIFDDPGICYLDNAATTQKPRVVLEALDRYYRTANANPHRSAHRLGMAATEAFESARAKVADFIGAASPEEIVFTKSATEALNLLSTVMGRDTLQEGDEILITIQEHHTNCVNWQAVAHRTGAKLVYAYLREDRTLDVDQLLALAGPQTKVVSFTQASNVTGAITDAAALIRRLREKTKACIIVDGAQSVPHMPVDVQAMDCDFLAASGHKMFAPMGIGFLYGKRERLSGLAPFLYGGDMIEYVYEQSASFLEAPFRFEAGTQNVGGAVALAAAIDFIRDIGGPEAIFAHEKALIDAAYARFSEMDDICLYTTPAEKTGVLSWNMEGAHPHDIATILDAEGIMIRSGHHCAQPLHRYFGRPFSARASFSVYNDMDDVEKLIRGLCRVREVLKIGTR